MSRWGLRFLGAGFFACRRLPLFADRRFTRRGIPHAVLCVGDRLHVAPGSDTVGACSVMGSSSAPRSAPSCSLIRSQFGLLSFAARPAMRIRAQLPFSFSPCNANFRLPFFRPSARHRHGVPTSRGPTALLSAAVLAFRNDPLESSVLERMVLNLNGKALVPGEVTRTFCNCPAFQHPIPS
jgi:hypothetical protein